MSVPDPPATQVEVENPEAAANNTTGANGVFMAEDNVEPEANVVPEANENLEASVTPIPTDGVVPPPRPHTMELAYNRDMELVTVHWPVLVPPTGPGRQYDYHVQQRPPV